MSVNKRPSRSIATITEGDNMSRSFQNLHCLDYITPHSTCQPQLSAPHPSFLYKYTRARACLGELFGKSSPIRSCWRYRITHRKKYFARVLRRLPLLSAPFIRPRRRSQTSPSKPLPRLSTDQGEKPFRFVCSHQASPHGRGGGETDREGDLPTLSPALAGALPRGRAFFVSTLHTATRFEPSNW